MNPNDTTPIYANTAANVARDFTALGRDGWKVTAPRALPEQGRDGERVIVRVEQGSACIKVTFELIEDPQWVIDIDIGGLPSKWDSDEVAVYTNAIGIAQRVAYLLQRHFA